MEQLDEQRQELLKAKLGQLSGWQPPDLVPCIGPGDPEAFPKFRARIDAIAGHCIEHLRGYSDADMEVLANETEADPNDVRANWDQFMRTEIRQLEKEKPPWFAGGFGHPEYQADLAYWARMSHFMLSEVACLSVGVDPKHFSYEKLEKISKDKEPEKLWPSMAFLRARYELLVRQFGRGWESDRRVDAWAFTAWAIRIELDMPDELGALLKRYHFGGDPSTAGEEGQPKKPDKREIDKIAQLFTAMAIDHLGYQPHDRRSPTPKQIVEIAAAMGLEVSTETVLKYLRIGAGFMPDDWLPPGR